MRSPGCVLVCVTHRSVHPGRPQLSEQDTRQITTVFIYFFFYARALFNKLWRANNDTGMTKHSLLRALAALYMLTAGPEAMLDNPALPATCRLPPWTSSPPVRPPRPDCRDRRHGTVQAVMNRRTRTYFKFCLKGQRKKRGLAGGALPWEMEINMISTVFKMYGRELFM